MLTIVLITLIGLFGIASPAEYTLYASAMSPVPHQVSKQSWNMEQGDRVIIDTHNNEGYLFHEDGEYLRFPIVSGQRRYVSYIGRYYNASTPNWSWEAKSLDVKGDRITFGPSGRFLRLYKDGQRTAYGLHEHRDEEEMFALEASKRFRSFGCIIVTKDMMDLLVNTFLHNGGSLDVISQHGVEDLRGVMARFTERSYRDTVSTNY